MLRNGRCFMYGAAAALLLVAAPASAVTATRREIRKGDQVLDEQGIWLENEYVKLGITQNEFAGQVMSFVYKPTGQELGTAAHPQGYCKDRMGEDRYFWKPRHSEGYSGKILGQSDEQASAGVSYTWNYDHNDVQTRIGVVKTYVLRRGSSALLVTWTLTNAGDQEAQMTPWVKNLGGQHEGVLGGPTVMLAAGGPEEQRGDFVKPTTDWIARLSGTDDSESAPMVCSVMDYGAIFQQFPWTGKVRFTLETVLNRIHLKPGESWSITYALCAMPNLGRPLYVCPELAATAETPTETLETGKEAHVSVHIAPALDLGDRRIEGEVLGLDGTLAAKLPNRQVTLVPGKICTLEYAFTPPSDGVYEFSLTVFDDGQQPVRLGLDVNSQRSSITLPVAAGPKPDMLVRTWESEGFSWPRRKPRALTPWRVLINEEALKAAQVLVPERIYPEDALSYRGDAQPAAVRLAKGEYEDIQFAVDFGDAADVTALEATVSPLKHASGAVLAGTTLREAICLTTETPSGYKNFPVGQWPDPLFLAGWEKKIPGAPVTAKNLAVMRAARRRVFWLTINAARNAAAGLYTGEVKLALPGKAEAVFPLEVTVRKFALPKRPALRASTNMVGYSGAKGRSNLRIMGLPDEEIERLVGKGGVGMGMMDAYRRLVLEYGWTPTMYFGGIKTWEQYENVGRGISVYPSGRPDKETEAWLKERGVLEYAFVYAPFDEHADVVVPEVAAWCREWKAKSEIPILDCYYGSNVEPLFGLVDVWLGQSPTHDWAKERKQKGDRFVSCNSSLIWHVEYEPVAGRAGFWSDFTTGVDGRYVYSTIRWTEDVYEKNWTSGNYMGCAVYPSPNGICTSIRMETLRDGVEDYDYLALLRGKVEQAEQGRDAEAVQDARAILEDVGLSDRVGTVRDLHAMRDRVGDLIERL